ncbi:glycosyltransferase family 4 protein [Candidatus Woesearchaeota archaeon]|nr:glycosyltransferase family 4 protein [Candidatus Woesearchaeota archaeon]
MFGWEFPPYKTGGLGTACHDLTKGLARQGVDVTFVMPVAPANANVRFVRLIGAEQTISFQPIQSLLLPYTTTEAYARIYSKATEKDVYGKNLFHEVQRYALLAGCIAKDNPHDIIHAHDWMTYGAAIHAKRISGKPLVVHIHATEYDRTLGHPNPAIRRLEHAGFHHADTIIANSHFLKQTVVEKYDISPQKITVVHWGIDQDRRAYAHDYKHTLREKKVLYLGRMAAMKGPDHFLRVAARVLQHVPSTKFVMVGGGEMLPQCVQLAADLGISQNVIFAGPLAGEDVHHAFQMADLFVMPSISEPFGLVALEALANKTPVLMSRQSGVSEVVSHALKVDFWDHDEMVNKIVAVLKYDSLRDELREQGASEVQKFTLDEPARKCVDIYHRLAPQVIIR